MEHTYTAVGNHLNVIIAEESLVEKVTSTVKKNNGDVCTTCDLLPDSHAQMSTGNTQTSMLATEHQQK